jgi:hypothetical protein
MKAPSSAPEPNRLPGVFYAAWEDGLELPVLDVTHPAFRVNSTSEELEAQAHDWTQQHNRAGFLGRWFHRYVLPKILSRSTIGRGLIAANRTHLDALTTYLLKLGPKALGNYSDLDRRISGSIAGTLLRLRVQDLASAQARALSPLLADDRHRPLHLLNVAGGPANDSLNTLLLLNRDNSHLLVQRKSTIHLLDLDANGSRFAANALAAWQTDGAPLHGVEVELDAKPFDWSQAASLDSIFESIASNAIVLVTSEGGLFDYGSDADILTTLSAVHQGAPDDAQICGTLSTPSDTGLAIRRGSLASVITRTVDDFTGLVAKASWALAEHWTRPTSSGFRLTKA